MRKLSQTHKPIFTILFFLLVAAVLFVVYGVRDQKIFQENQERMARQSVLGASENVQVMMENLRKSLHFFSQNSSHLLEILANDPENIHIHNMIDSLLTKHYKNYYAFTVADYHGHILYDDFGERVGPRCIQDIKQFAQSGNQSEIYIHPGPGAYHFDLMFRWPGGDGKVFFASFKADAIAKLIRNTEVAGHELMLLRKDVPGLIEVTAQGSRARRSAEEFRLSKLEQERILFEQAMANTRWNMVDIPNKNLIADYRFFMWTQYIVIMLVLAMTAIFLVTRIWREEKQRQEMEVQLRNSRDQLEIRVKERTQDLQQSNERLELEISERKKLIRVVEQTDDSVIIVDRDGQITYVNPSFEKRTGYDSQDSVGKPVEYIQKEFDRGLFEQALKEGGYSNIFKIQCKNDNELYEEKAVTMLRDDNGKVIQFVVTGKDISDRIAAQRKIDYLAHHDPLTELGNRSKLVAHLKQAMLDCETNENLIAILFLDLDRFKTINDSMGHTAGDILLKEIAARLRSKTDQQDVIARLGDDDFALILEGRKEVKEIMQTAEELIGEIAKPCVVDDKNIICTASIGVSLFPFDDDVDVLLKHANTALHRAKDAGGNCIRFYAEEMGNIVNKRMQIESRLHHALERNEYLIYYQPRIQLDTGRITGAEALIRWNNPDLGLVQPGEFIPLLEENGQIVEVGEWVLKQACEDYQSLPRYLRLAVNLSARQLQQPQIADDIINIALGERMDLSRLDIEVTESLLIKEELQVDKTLNILHNAGIKVALDDFGTGYSSLSYLKDFPIDCLKVDRSFVKNLQQENDDSYNLVAGIISMAHNLRMSVVAEGIETERQRELIKQLSAEEVQGFLFSKPVPLNEFRTQVEAQQPPTISPQSRRSAS